MNSTMDLVCNVLGIDRIDMNGRMILIEEQHGSNANFVLSSIISNALKKNHGICLVLFHNTFNHYQNVSMKLGYNLTALLEKGRVTVVEPMKTVVSDIERISEDAVNASDSILIDSTSETNADIVYNLFRTVKDSYDKVAESTESAVIIVDDLSHFCNLGLTLRDTMYFVRYLRSLVEHKPLCQLCIVIHAYESESQNCTPDVLANSLKQMAHLFVTVEPLKTGYSSDASGKMIINWKVNSIRREYHWPEIATYLYKLSDRQVKVYAPGAATVLA